MYAWSAPKTHINPALSKSSVLSLSFQIINDHYLIRNNVTNHHVLSLIYYTFTTFIFMSRTKQSQVLRRQVKHRRQLLHWLHWTTRQMTTTADMKIRSKDV
ncbi:unnamed protein product [Linum trigynum]|uniref:Uncharacterized protein n=1 Tax=Linum trigynum TaxID=586398 RepID=A0AAV2FJZ9_9ROSI